MWQMKALVIAASGWLAVASCGAPRAPEPLSARAPEPTARDLVARARALITQQPSVMVTTTGRFPRTNATEAIALLQRAIAATSEPTILDEALLLLGDQLILVGDNPGAAAAFARVSPANRHATLARYKAGWAHYRGGDLKAAIAAFEPIMTTPTDLQREAIVYVALSWSELDEQLPAMTRYQRALAHYQGRRDGVTGELLEALGDAFKDRMEVDAATAAYQYVLATWPTTSHGDAIRRKLAELAQP